MVIVVVATTKIMIMVLARAATTAAEVHRRRRLRGGFGDEARGGRWEETRRRRGGLEQGRFAAAGGVVRGPRGRRPLGGVGVVARLAGPRDLRARGGGVAVEFVVWWGRGRPDDLHDEVRHSELDFQLDEIHQGMKLDVTGGPPN